jgi:hypothetical protein
LQDFIVDEATEAPVPEKVPDWHAFGPDLTNHRDWTLPGCAKILSRPCRILLNGRGP